MGHIRIARSIAFMALVGALVLVPVATLAGSDRAAPKASDSPDSGNQAAVSVLGDMTQVMQHWMSEMSNSRGLTPDQARRMSDAMRKMSGMMQDMSSMMQSASKTGSHSGNMMGGGHGMMMGSGHGMMMDSQMMQRMHEQMRTLLKNERQG